jgi:iron(III) transport system substrate-binding protein
LHSQIIFGTLALSFQRADSMHPIATAVASLFILAAVPAAAQENVVNIYSARHYQTDEALYGNFTKQTGIKINRIEAGENELLERIKNRRCSASGKSR